MDEPLGATDVLVAHDTDDAPRAAQLRACGLLEPGRDSDLDRWVVAAGRNARAAAAALCLFDGPGQVVTSVWAAAGSAARSGRLGAGESLGSRLRGLVGGPAEGCLVAERPVVVGGQTVGRLGIAGTGRTEWSVDELAAVADAAAAVSGKIEVRLATAEVARVQRLVASHNRVHEMIARREPLPAVLAAACDAIQDYDPSLLPSVLLRDPESNTLHSGVGPAFPREYLDSIDGAPIGPSIGTCGPAAWFGRLTISENLDEDPNWGPIRSMARLAGVAHCWSMPIKDSDDVVLGTLALYGRAPRRPQPEHVALLQDWARIAGAAIERAHSLDQLTHDARHDGLTGLPNRVAILERLDHAITRIRPDAAVAVLFIDLDGLKAMNDTLGHDVADQMLRTVGRRLSAGVRARDFVGRLGGDEFVVIAEGITETDEAGLLGARLLETVAQRLTGLTSMLVTASIGIALVRSSDIDAHAALRKADEAMYEAKRAGKDRCVFAEIGETVQAGRRLRLARELPGAEARGELQLAYQPIIALADRRTTGVEALLRWKNPTLGDIEPDEFIPIAEDTGSMIPIGAWVLRESCETLARRTGPGEGTGRRLDLSVNISHRQLSNPDFPTWVRQTLAHAELPADRLIIDITEGCLVQRDDVTLQNLRDVHALGVRVALDDFGTGDTALSWLRDDLIHIIKIDHSVVARLHHRRDRAVTTALVDMAHALGCTVTAEGVETEAQLHAVTALSCDHAQGSHLAPPVPAERLDTLPTLA
jgi:diguanylate cyclase (GGDEF)-like protein